MAGRRRSRRLAVCAPSPPDLARFPLLRTSLRLGADPTTLLSRTTDTAPAQDGLWATEIRIGTRFHCVGAFLTSVVQFPYAPTWAPTDRGVMNHYLAKVLAEQRIAELRARAAQRRLYRQARGRRARPTGPRHDPTDHDS